MHKHMHKHMHSTCTAHLARDVVGDVTVLLGHARPVARAALALRCDLVRARVRVRVRARARARVRVRARARATVRVRARVRVRVRVGSLRRPSP